MKNFQKSICILLSAILLFSGMPIFAQQQLLPNVLSSDERVKLTNEMEELNDILEDLRTSVNTISKDAITEAKLREELFISRDKVRLLKKKYPGLVSEIRNYRGRLEKEIQKMYNESVTKGTVNNSVLEMLSARYSDSGTILKDPGMIPIEKVNLSYLDNLESKINQLLERPELFTRDEAAYIREMDNMFSLQVINEAKIEYKILRDRSSSLFKSLEEWLAILDPKDIWKYAFEHLSPQEQANVKLMIRAKSEAPKARNLASSIMSYLRKFRGSAEERGLIRTLKLSNKLSKLNKEERVKYIRDITEIKPGQMRLARDISKHPHAAARFLKLGTPLMVVGAIVTVMSITEVNAQNVFPAEASMRLSNTVRKRIEAEEDLSAAETYDWYTNPNNESFIDSNRAHYANMIGILFLLAQADADKDEILDILVQSDNEIANYGVQNRVEKSFESTFEKYNKQKTGKH